MKKATLIAVTAVLFALMSSIVFAQAGNTASGTLTVSALVNSSINLVFNSDAAGLTLKSGEGTNTAALDFGAVSVFGSLVSTAITRSVGGSSFSVSTPVDVKVTQFNSSSANYTLSAQLQSPDAVNTWSVGGTTISNAAPANVTTNGTYGNKTAEAIAISIPFTEASGTSISNIINFTATSN